MNGFRWRNRELWMCLNAVIQYRLNFPATDKPVGEGSGRATAMATMASRTTQVPRLCQPYCSSGTNHMYLYVDLFDE